MSKICLSFLIFIALWGGYVPQTTAQANPDSLIIRVTDDETTLESLNKYIYVLEDTTNALSFEQIRSAKVQQGFLPYTTFHKQNPKLKRHRAYWAKIIFKNESDRNHWILYAGGGDFLELYTPDEQGNYQKSKSGRLTKGKSREIKKIGVEATYKFHIKLLPYQNTIIYLKISGLLYSPRYLLKLVTPKVYFKKEAQRNTLQNIFQGGLWIIILYNFILFLLVRDKTYLFYVLYTLSYSLYYIMYYDFYNEVPKLQIYISIFSSQISMLFYFQFMRCFVNSKAIIKKWDKIIRIWILVKFLSLITFLIYLIISFNTLFLELYLVVHFYADTSLFLITIVILLISRNVLARYLVTSSFFLMLGWVLSTISFSDLIDVSFNRNYFSQAGLFLELVLFSVGLGYRERKNEQDKRLAQEENARILKEQTVALEKGVNIRTKEIKEQKEELAQQAEELKTAYNQLQNLGKFKNQMTDMIVHDLKNPLVSIMGIVDSNTEGRLDKTQITSATRQMLYMVQNLLDVQKSEEAEMNLNIGEIAIGSVIKEVIAQQRILAHNKNINLRYNVLLGDIVKADADILLRILSNLMSNSIKFTPTGGEVSLHSSYTAHDTLLKIEVRDNGMGIPSGQLDKVFDKFYALDKAQRGKFRSTGLGLTFCKLAVEQQGGTIGVTSKEGAGTQFWFTLPLVAKAGETTILLHAPQNTQPNIILDEIVKVKAALQGKDLELAQAIVQQIHKEGINHTYPIRLIRVFEIVKSKMKLSPAIVQWMQMLEKDATNEVFFEALIHLDKE